MRNPQRSSFHGWKKVLHEMLWYGALSVPVSLVNQGILVMIVEGTGISKFLAFAPGFVAGTIMSFVLNTKLTFNGDGYSQDGRKIVGWAFCGAMQLIGGWMIFAAILMLAPSVPYPAANAVSGPIPGIMAFLARRQHMKSNKGALGLPWKKVVANEA